ncbi:MAG: polyribonucleotide nucleotidyltransferase [Nitrospinae bacterium RIFCSPLOWO2_02_39_17]|nr:MAG: polyribonucleotide nucleotidyltransferase [Nitrospinae bacterium RIFCSPHIGHO2_02_FULL_39_82]OGW03705.1 MAG: polyribonucleotide nucleotidyltransferase [Nitrospinae bacterium RIFCSPLOWO2_02_39_17]OGW08403.1 MAG: polyribonucleotide nucleotidyltransferase [Nitrospinae bacterium RIFCSPLOWO2_12_39_15]OGW12173.1 MAG: polyribonucleotide nucleotidyltransferase [Nitrospinae bacterium RIFCSPLOWO2_12_FULL_39_93]
MNLQQVELGINGNKLSIETGVIAKQANGSALVRYGDTVIIATAVASKEPKEGIDFLPLTVDYREKFYSAGKIPGGFFKREGKPSEREVLISRLIDRPLRPLFPEGFTNEIQIICFVLSADQKYDPDILSIIGASAALTVSDIPLTNPVGAVRVGRVDGKLMINPSYEEIEKSDVNIVIAGTRESIVMVEGGAKEIPESIIIDALVYGHEEIKKIVDIQLELQKKVNEEKFKVVDIVSGKSDIIKTVREFAGRRLEEAVVIKGKKERQSRIDEILKDTLDHLKGNEENKDLGADIKNAFEHLESDTVRRLITEKGIRIDGRRLKDIRPIDIKIGILPRTHGSAIFTRGETQALVVATLGTSVDKQRLDNLQGKTSKGFMLHYNFPPFSVGEVKFTGSPGRREIGHGALAERAVLPILPDDEVFPYTIRIVSDILESNGSSSMATVCGASLSLMDAGVPIKSPVAGIAMGLIKEGDNICILSDILGTEDHLGDMDFKVAGTSNGITAIQMDIKMTGVTKEIMEMALEQAREGRLHVLKEMEKVIAQPKSNLSIYAPRIVTMQIKSEKVKDVIGPGGKVIRGIIKETGVNIDIEDDGTISIASPDENAVNKAVDIIKEITQEVEVGRIYMGKVRKIMDFGAFVEIFPGTDGLVHISQLTDRRVTNVYDEVKEGEEMLVKVLEVDRQGKIRLSRKDALREGDDKEKDSRGDISKGSFR